MRRHDLASRAWPVDRPLAWQAEFTQTLCADIDGFSLHAAVRSEADAVDALQQRCQSVARPALAKDCVQTIAVGQVVQRLKALWRGLHPTTDSRPSGAVFRPCSAVFGVPWGRKQGVGKAHPFQVFPATDNGRS